MQWVQRALMVCIAASVFALGASSAIAQGDAAASSNGALQSQIDAEAARIQADPPVHERAEPWSVPVREVELESQPLRMEQLEERVNAWLELLQQKVRERNRLNIAADQAEAGSDLKQGLTTRANRLQNQVMAVAERAEAVVLLFEDRGGDAKQYEKYIAHATDQEINWLDPDIAMAWLTDVEGGIAVALNILKFLAILIAFWIASKIIGALVGKAMGRVAKDQSDMLKRVVQRNVKRLVLIVGFVVALGQLGVNIGPLVAAIGAAGLVIGLALQGVLSNFASGILILVNRPYDVGDVIEAGGITGKVERMTLVNTKVLTFDNKIMHVPNDAIWSDVITNITGLPTRRVDLVFGIGYSDDIAKAESIIADIIKSHPAVLQDPAPTIKLNELADSSVNFVVRPWSKKEDYWDVYWDVTRQIKERFDAEGIGIPFPQRDLHLPEAVRVVVSNEA